MRRNVNSGNRHHFLENTVLLSAFSTFFSSEVSTCVFSVEIRNISKLQSEGSIVVAVSDALSSSNHEISPLNPCTKASSNLVMHWALYRVCSSSTCTGVNDSRMREKCFYS